MWGEWGFFSVFFFNLKDRENVECNTLKLTFGRWGISQTFLLNNSQTCMRNINLLFIFMVLSSTFVVSIQKTKK